MRNTFRLAALSAALYCASSAALSMTKEDAQALGTSVGNLALSSGPLTPNDLNVKGSTPSATDNVWGAGFTGGTDPAQTAKVTAPSMIGVGNEAKTTAHDNFTAYTNDRAQQAEQATYFLTTRTNTKPILSSDDPIFRSVNVLKNGPTFASATTAGCTQPEFMTTYDADAIYTCTQSYTTYTTSCRREAAPDCVPAPASATCSATGIVAGSAAINNGSYSFTFNGYDLLIRNNVTAKNSVTTATFSFMVASVDLIKQFKLTGIESDNWVGLTVNGTYIGTHTRLFGGFATWSDRLVMEGGQVRYSDTGYHAPETGGGFYSALDIDIKPHLKDGENTIVMNVVNGGGPGMGAAYFKATQKCPAICEMKWSDFCGSHEGLVQ